MRIHKMYYFVLIFALFSVYKGTAQTNFSRGEEYFLHMNGREVFKYAVRYMSQISQDLLKRNGLSVADVDLVIPHQANHRIIEAVGKRMEVSDDRVYSVISRYGNTSAASIPLALGDARRENRLVPGSRLLLPVFGGGFTWGAALLEVD